MDKKELKEVIMHEICLPCVHFNRHGRCEEENCSLRNKAAKAILAEIDWQIKKDNL